MAFFKKEEKKKEVKEEPKKESLTDSERLQNGELLCRFIIEIVGKPKEHVEASLDDYVKFIKKNDSYTVVTEEFADAEENEGLFTKFVEIEVWVRNLNALLSFCFDYMPSSIEIIEPEHINYESSEFAGLLNDLQAKLHDMDMRIKVGNQEKLHIQNNAERILKNLVIHAISKEKLGVDELSKIVGIESKGLTAFLDKFVKEGKIKLEKDKYSLVETI